MMRKYLFFLSIAISIGAAAQTPLNTSNGVKTLGSQYTGDLNTNQNWGGTGMSGMYLFNAQTNSNVPSTYPGNWFHVIEMQHDNSNNWTGQIALGYFTDGMYYRQQNNGTWGSWHTVATQDWLQSNYLPLNGGDMTGKIGTPYLSFNNGNSQPVNANNVAIFPNNNTGTLDLVGWSGGFRFIPNNGANYPSPFMVINGNGNMGLGTASPQALLDVGKYISNGTIGTVLARQSEGDNSALGTSLSVRAWETQFTNYNGKSFSIEHSFYGGVNCAINFYRGGGTTGGYMTFATNNGTEQMRIDPSGNVGIGTTNTSACKLSVNGNIRTQEVNVTATGWPDYVFTSAYKLPTLEDLAAQIQMQGHLPNIPSAEEVSKNGIALGEMNKKLLEKVEELTLYAIKQNEEIKELKTVKEESKQQKEVIEKLLQRIEKLENKK